MTSATIFPELANEFAGMLAELEAAPLLVVLCPAPDSRHAGHMVRRPASVPPSWYRSLCRAYASSRGVPT
jgi:hypothetical protein